VIIYFLAAPQVSYHRQQQHNQILGFGVQAAVSNVDTEEVLIGALPCFAFF
jgi:hypothetical protein